MQTSTRSVTDIEVLDDAPALDAQCINCIRALAMDAVEAAGSGHPGAPMGLAPAAYVLWTRYLKHDPRDTGWFDRDRFVLSAGHASMLLYALLHLTGYELSLDDLRAFRQWGSRTPGHPEHGLTPGVETTSGPLGQGFGNAVGMAIAERIMGERFNRPYHTIVEHRTWVIASDGDLMEGISHEAASLAGHLGLHKLTMLYDANAITIDGPTDLAFSEDVAARFGAYGWHVTHVADGNDLDAIDGALRDATRGERPTLVVLRTHIGYGAPTKQDTAAAHGAPLGAEEVARAKEFLGWPREPAFHVPIDVPLSMRAAGARAGRKATAWRAALARYATAEPALHREFVRALKGELPMGWDADLPRYEPGAKPIATRQASAASIAAIAPRVHALCGGSADLTESTGTAIPGEATLSARTAGRFIHFGVREHAMGAALNGMALHGGLRPFGGTFLVFSDYMRPAIRLAALMRLPVVFVFTHDSIALGEDGPTHQPIEHLAALRAIPGLTVIRPADGNETAAAWRIAMTNRDGPVALVLSRQALPILEGTLGAPVERGAYVLRSAARPRIGIVATGSEVALAVETAELLEEDGIGADVVSMPSWELFERQDRAYRDSVFPPGVPFLSLEAALPLGWARYATMNYGLDGFGASAPGATVMRERGFNAAAVAVAARELITR